MSFEVLFFHTWWSSTLIIVFSLRRERRLDGVLQNIGAPAWWEDDAWILPRTRELRHNTDPAEVRGL